MRIISAPVTPELRARVDAAFAAYHASVAVHGAADAWDRSVIDKVIDAFVSQGRPFSANDMRELLPVVRKCLVGARLNSYQRRGLIRRVGITPSSLQSTKGAHVAVYAPVRGVL